MLLCVFGFDGLSVVSQQRPLGFECNTEWKVREDLFEKWMKQDPFVRETAEEAMAQSDQCAAYQTLAYVDFVRNVQSSGPGCPDHHNLPCSMSLMCRDTGLQLVLNFSLVHLRSNGAWHLHWNPFRLWSTPPLLHCAS